MMFCECCARMPPEVEIRSETLEEPKTKRTCCVSLCRECSRKAHGGDSETWQKLQPFLAR